MNIKKTRYLIAALSIICFISVAFYFKNKKPTAVLPLVSNFKEENNNTSEIESVKIVNVVRAYKLPEGTQTYNISHGENVTGPKAEKISYDPLSITPNSTQTVTVTFPKSENMSSGVIFITTDKLEKQKLTLKKNEELSTDFDVWEGTWTPTDTINSRYNARLYFVGPNGTYNNVMNFL